VGYASCKFCNTPFVRNTHEDAIPCAQCRTLNEKGAQRCVRCQAWVVVQCVFCRALSPHHEPACVQCGETFAGAMERYQQRQEEVQNQQRMQVVATVGTVAASFLGAVAGAALTDRPHHAHRHHHRHHDDDNDHDEGGGFFASASGEVSDDGEEGGILDAIFGDD